VTCWSCGEPISPARYGFGFRENDKTHERAHTECLKRVSEYGDPPGKAWANAKAWGPIQFGGA
jgi:hypothetical protein